MANKGIERVGELAIEQGIGAIRLRTREMEHISALNGEPVRGSLATLKYYDGAAYRDAAICGQGCVIPACAVDFVCVSGRVMHGDIMLKVTCTAGTEHMPESESLLEIAFAG